ncbi:MAG: carboxypeptidase regulatory-like domain-containing protein [Candidatus Handelsmanbacteria bacterium]|nr:carboxypeptidase regulatory-like domain-containing protein [Candidatus Handelsmanbacteria bacterium]
MKGTVLLAALLLSAQWGGAAALKGVVKAQLSGPAPSTQVQMTDDPSCAAKHTTPVVDEKLVLDAAKNVRYAFVSIKAGLPQGQQLRPPAEPALIDQHGCMFAPRVVGVMVGQGLKVLNSDGVLHNVHLMGKANREVNKAMPAFTKKMVLPGTTFAKPETIPLKCDAHPWMAGYVIVTAHPYFAVTGADGSFEIKDLPPGKYTVEVWHEYLGTKAQEVQVTDTGATANFTLAK